MKELTVEEKAKRYDETLKAAVVAHKDEDRHLKAALERIFPELKESEDEKIRKTLIELFSNIGKKDWRDIPTEKIIAWLEKQCDKSTTLPKWKYKKDKTPLLRDSIILNKYGCVAKSPYGAIISDVWVLDYNELAKLPKEEFEKQGEQNPADKLEDEEYNGEDYGIDSLFHAQRILEKTLGKVNGYQTDDGILSHQCAITAVKKLYEQKPAGWSEEDETRLTNIIIMLKEGASHHFIKDDITKAVDWLKSLRPQNHWKPTEEQVSTMKYLAKYYTKGCEPTRSIIEGLYEQLKQL